MRAKEVSCGSWGVFTSYSRYFTAVQSHFMYAMYVGILFSDPYIWLILSFIIFTPLIAASALEVFVYTGRFFEITDDDIDSVLLWRQGKKICM